MKVLWRLAVSCVVVCLLLTSIASGTPEWMNRPGTIGHALSLPDGSRVCLDAVVVDKIRARQVPAYFVIRECFDSTARLVVYAPPSPLLRFGQTVDVYGTIDTLPNGSRAIVNASVFGYTDSEGDLLYHGPLIKGLLAPTAWEWKSALTTYSVQGTARALDLPTPPGEPNPAPGDPPVYCATIAAAKARGDGTAVELQCKPIDSASSGYFIMAEDDTSDTLTVYYT